MFNLNELKKETTNDNRYERRLATTIDGREGTQRTQTPESFALSSFAANSLPGKQGFV
jgi:hypothetical protein